MTWILPFPDKAITGHFGTLSAYRKSKGMQPHSGTDWAGKAGTLIPAISSGEVKLIQYSNILGWVVVQSATDNKGKTKYIGYCHLFCSFHGAECKGPKQGCKTPLKSTKVGDKVETGQKYLKLGNSGSATTGPHLHATLSNSVKGVFGATSVKEDLHKFIKAQQAVTSAKPEPKPELKSEPEVRIVYACPHCKKELS